MKAAEAFTILGIAKSASPAEIKAAGRELSQRTHPDKGGCVEEFNAAREAIKVAMAYALLTPCDVCDGDGWVSTVRNFVTSRKTCPACQGSGKKYCT